MKSPLGIALLLALAAGCGTEETKEAIEHGWSADTCSKWGNDPVAVSLIRKENAVRREYRGAVYYFRDEVEAGAFDSNPAAYVADPESEAIDADSKGTDPHSTAHSP